MEHAKSLGLASCGTHHNPCGFCHCNADELHEFYDDMIDDDGVTWALREHDEYEATCRECEIDVTIDNEATRQQLLRSMDWLKGQGSKNRGRTVITNVTVGGVQLCPGDRLDPSPRLVDNALLSRIPLPATVTFWRPRFGGSTLPLDSVVHRIRFCFFWMRVQLRECMGVRIGGVDVTTYSCRRQAARIHRGKIGSRCPLFDADVLQTSPTRTLAID
eukprot:3103121-Pyramimonas_sp.AAC.1